MAAMRSGQTLLTIMLSVYISLPVPYSSVGLDLDACAAGERVEAAAPHPVAGTPAGSARAGASEEPGAALSDTDVTTASFNWNISLLVALFETPQKLLPFADPSYPIAKPPQ
jgi:hypothetical protein